MMVNVSFYGYSMGKDSRDKYILSSVITAGIVFVGDKDGNFTIMGMD
jgi:hypothetical protein